MALAPVLAVGLVFAGCGGNGEGEPQTTAQETAAGVNTEVFCESVAAAETAVLAASSGGEPPENLSELVTSVEENAPENLSQEVATVVAGVREVMETGIDEAFRTDGFTDSDEAIDQWVADSCGFETVEIAAVDYAFEGVPETLPAGITTFRFTNEGEEVHEMLMVRYKDENLSVEDLMEMSDKEAQKKIAFIGASFGPPGSRGRREQGAHARQVCVGVLRAGRRDRRGGDGQGEGTAARSEGDVGRVRRRVGTLVPRGLIDGVRGFAEEPTSQSLFRISHGCFVSPSRRPLPPGGPENEGSCE